jgi:hypothetical protein
VDANRSTAREANNVDKKSWHISHEGELYLLCACRRIGEQNYISPLLYLKLLVASFDNLTFPISSFLPAVGSCVGDMRVQSRIQDPSIDQAWLDCLLVCTVCAHSELQHMAVKIFECRAPIIKLTWRTCSCQSCCACVCLESRLHSSSKW